MFQNCACSSPNCTVYRSSVRACLLSLTSTTVPVRPVNRVSMRELISTRSPTLKRGCLLFDSGMISNIWRIASERNRGNPELEKLNGVEAQYRHLPIRSRHWCYDVRSISRPRTPWFYKPLMNNVLLAVSQRSLFLAESRIVGCSNCSSRTTVRFERVLDEITGSDEECCYVLPAPAMCPFCTAPVTEKTMVQLRQDDACRVWTLSKFDTTE
jgi:hypothetical protein